MIVVDSTAWIDLIRARQTAVALTLRRLIEAGADIAITETVLMEVLAGATSPRGLEEARKRLLGRPILRLEGIDDFDEAARIYRICRAAGEELRSHLDLLIAVPTIRHGATLLHNDRDFETIARHTALKLEPVDGRGQRDAGPQLRERRARWRGRPARRQRREAVRAR